MDKWVSPINAKAKLLVIFDNNDYEIDEQHRQALSDFP